MPCVLEPRSKIEDEVVINFFSASIRDTTKGVGYKLEGKNAGIRMEILTYLCSDFQILQNLSYKKK